MANRSSMRRVWRVSSAAMTWASRSTRSARCVTSSRLPIGVATRYRMPLTSRRTLADGPVPVHRPRRAWTSRAAAGGGERFLERLAERRDRALDTGVVDVEMDDGADAARPGGTHAHAAPSERFDDAIAVERGVLQLAHHDVGLGLGGPHHLGAQTGREPLSAHWTPRHAG